MFFVPNSYTPLYSNNKHAIFNAGTRSGLTEEFESLLKDAFPDKKWVLKKSVPLSNGWYQVTYLSVNKSDTNNFNAKFNIHVWRVHHSPNGLWELIEEDV